MSAQRTPFVIQSWLAALMFAGSLQADPLYLDINGTNPGAGEDGTGSLTTAWDAAATIWNSDSTGAGVGGGVWVPASIATFSAGTAATGLVNVTVAGTHSLGGLEVNQGTVNLSGTGVLDFSSPSRLLSIASGLTMTISTQISGTSTAALTKAGAGTLVLDNAANNYTGQTLIQEGILKVSTTNSLPVTTDLFFGSNATATPALTTGGLDLTTASQTVHNLSIFTNNSTDNTITIGAGQTFQANGGVTVGPNYFAAAVGPLPVTRLTLSGDGEFIVTGTSNRTFSIAGVIASSSGSHGNRGNSATLDLSGLAKFTADLGSGGIFRVGDTSTGSSAAISTALLAKETVLKAGTLSTSSQNVSGVPSTVLKLGSISNLIQADTINIGMGGGRAFGTMDFQTTTGTLTIRGYAGGETDRALLTVGYGLGNTSNGGVGGMVNLVGHESDLLLSALQVAGRTSTVGGSLKESTFSFNMGLLDATSVIIGYRGGSTTGSSGRVIGVMNLGTAEDTVSGEVIIGSGGLTIGTNVATFAQATNTVTSTVNIAGLVEVSIGATDGTSIILGNAATLGFTALSTLNITGGSTTLSGDIAKGTGDGHATVTSTLTLDGGSLDLGGGGSAHSIGSADRPINNVNLRSGTLMNVAGINGGADLIKTTTGSLLLTGANAYSGGTHVQAGTLQVGSGGTGQTGTGSTTVSAGATLAGTGLILGSATLTGSAGNLVLLTPGDDFGTGLGTLRFAQALTLADHGQIQLQIQDATLNAPGLLAAFSLGDTAYQAYLTSQTATYKTTDLTPGSHDFLSITGALTLATGTSGGVIRLSGDYSPSTGDVFHLLDWSGILGGGFTLGGATYTPGGQVGDLYLPLLTSGQTWDVSRFTSTGLIFVIPEPSRCVLLLAGLLSLLTHRRRKASAV